MTTCQTLSSFDKHLISEFFNSLLNMFLKTISLYLAVSISARCQKAKVVADTYSTKSATLSTQTVYLAEFSIACENEEQV